MEFLSDITYWHWLIFGIVLIVIEVFLPSAVFLWPGIAAILLGIISYAVPSLTPITLVLIWAFLSVGLAFGWQIYRKKYPAPSPVSTMNRRGSEYIGRHYTLEHDIENGTGELNVDDTRWKITSDTDLPKGQKVKVLSVDGTSLRVEKFNS